MTRQMQKLLKSVEEKVVPTLVSNELVKIIDNKKGFKFTNCRITAKGKQAIGEDQMNISKEWIKKYRNLFPKGRQSSPSAVRDKIYKLMSEDIPEVEDIETLDDIYNSAKVYIKDLNHEKYCCSANNFIYKYDTRGVMSSYLLEYLERKNEANNDRKDYSGTRTI